MSKIEDKETSEKSLIKRNRLTLVCQTCKRRKVKCDRIKPSCSTCFKTGSECVYKPLARSPFTLEPQTLEEDKFENGVSDLQRLSKKELLEEFIKLKSSISKDNQGEVGSAGSTVGNSVSGNDILINFYERYSPLSLKSSSHEDYKPLNPLAIHKKDAYYLFYLSYLTLTLRANNTLSDTFKGSWKSKHMDGITKWILLLDTQNEDHDLRDSVKKIVNDRSLLFYNNGFPINQQVASDETFELLKPEIVKLLPSTAFLLRVYLDYFWSFIWPLRPILDKVQFEENVKRIIHYDNYEISINLSQRQDMATIATLLIILRYITISLQVMNPNDISIEFRELLQYPVSVKAITVAQSCLSFYKLSRKTTLEILQALLFLRYYYRDSPEDGDGVTLLQSESLMGLIMQAALNMGLNREIPDYSQSFKVSELNLRRRIWYSIVEIHSRSVALAGVLSIMPNQSAINVNCPIVLSFDSFERAQRDEILKEYQLSEIYLGISEVINDIRNLTSLRKLNGLLFKSRTIIDEQYNFNELETVNKTELSSLFKNIKIYTKNVIQLLVEVQIHQSICLFSETNDHLDVELYATHYKSLITRMTKLIELSGSYLLDDLHDKLPSFFSYEINPLLNTAHNRIELVIASQMIRLYHLQDLKQNNIPEQLILKLLDSFRKLFGSVLASSRGLARHYQVALKNYAPQNYGFRALVNQKSGMIKNVLKCFTKGGKLNGVRLSDDSLVELQERYSKEESLLRFYNEWGSIKSTNGGDVKGKSSDSIINSKVSNMFLLMKRDFIEDINTIVTKPFGSSKLNEMVKKDIYSETNPSNSINNILGLEFSQPEFAYDFAFLDEIIKSVDNLN